MQLSAPLVLHISQDEAHLECVKIICLILNSQSLDWAKAGYPIQKNKQHITILKQSFAYLKMVLIEAQTKSSHIIMWLRALDTSVLNHSPTTADSLHCGFDYTSSWKLLTFYVLV